MPTFDTPAPISATVDIILGDIRFIAGDRCDTVVEVHPIDRYRRLDIEAADEVNIEFADGQLLVEHPRLRKTVTDRYGAVAVLVRLPTGSDVQGDTAQGEYRVQGAVGSCRLRNAIGDIRVGQATDVRLKTTGGKVSGAIALRIAGRVEPGRVRGQIAQMSSVNAAATRDLGGASTASS